MACAGGPADYTLQYARRVYTAVHTDARAHVRYFGVLGVYGFI